MRAVVIPEGHEVGGQAALRIIGQGLRRTQEAGDGGIAIAGGEAVERPSLSARPTGIMTVPLILFAPDQQTGIGIKVGDMGSGAIAPDERQPRCACVQRRDISQPCVAGDLARPIKQRQVHHQDRYWCGPRHLRMPSSSQACRYSPRGLNLLNQACTRLQCALSKKAGIPGEAPGDDMRQVKDESQIVSATCFVFKCASSARPVLGRRIAKRRVARMRVGKPEQVRSRSHRPSARRRAPSRLVSTCRV